MELSWSNNAFRSRFREVTSFHVGESQVIGDVHDIDPRAERATLRRQLLDETEFDPRTGYEVGVVLPETADWESQRLHRYRLVTISNFLTTDEKVNEFRPSLLKILSDIQPGAILLVVGGVHGNYPGIYSELDKVAAESGLTVRIAGESVRSSPSDSATIIAAARTIARHVEHLSAMSDDVPEEVRRALNRGQWGGTSGIRVYRRNPRRQQRTAGPTPRPARR